jgi:hypothetical protein
MERRRRARVCELLTILMGLAILGSGLRSVFKSRNAAGIEAALAARQSVSLGRNSVIQSYTIVSVW